eukprot:13841155-Heterocapsa_arctica.AAC.1
MALVRLRLDGRVEMPARQRIPVAMIDYQILTDLTDIPAGQEETYQFITEDGAFAGWPVAVDLRHAVSQW